MTHFGHGTVTVITQAFDHDGSTARAVAFINDGFHVGIIVTAHATRDGTVQGIARHVVGQRLVDRRTQTRVSPRIATAQFRGGHQLTNNFGENFTALGILRCLAVLGVGPLTMTCHKKSPKKITGLN
ncbi:hypothetical protein D3C80_692970 [compost metagenome]